MINALEKMLLLDPDRRVSASEALELRMFTDFREPEEETDALPYDHSMDNTDLPLEQWKRKYRYTRADIYITIYNKCANYKVDG